LSLDWLGFPLFVTLAISKNLTVCDFVLCTIVLNSVTEPLLQATSTAVSMSQTQIIRKDIFERRFKMIILLVYCNVSLLYG